MDCGAAQKPANAQFLDETTAVYNAYAIYHQAEGAEQVVFDQEAGLPASRSGRLIEQFFKYTALPNNGRVLDVGCGNGAMLRAFSGVAPGWRLAGTELTAKYRSDIEAIPNAESLHVGPVDDVAGTFDVITLIHTLEHMVEPVSVLRSLASKLKPRGVMLIEVPHHVDNPFELLIADHRSHFSIATIEKALSQAGYASLLVATDWVAKELSVVAQPLPGSLAQDVAQSIEPNTAKNVVEQRLGWLRRVADAAHNYARNAPFGLFGTSIAGTWLAAELGDRVDFFVDEDPNRIGKNYLGKRIIAPADVSAGATVFVAMPPTVALSICGRLARAGVAYLPPPA
jgi:SAM-dependent methyltransferase